MLRGLEIWRCGDVEGSWDLTCVLVAHGVGRFWLDSAGMGPKVSRFCQLCLRQHVGVNQAHEVRTLSSEPQPGPACSYT